MILKRRGIKKIYVPVSADLLQRYEEIKKLAKERKLIVDFRREFARWFNSVLKKTEKSIKSYSDEKASPKKSTKKSGSSTQLEMPLDEEETPTNHPSK